MASSRGSHPRARPTPRGPVPGSDTVGVAGLGYMGLATALGFAHHGWAVLGYDRLSTLRESLRRGRAQIHEPGLSDLLREQLGRGRFGVADSWEELAHRARTVFVCLPTPEGPRGRIDLRPIAAGVQELGRALRATAGRRLVVIKSTVVPGTSDRVLRPLLERSAGKGPEQVSLAASPEFLSEGTMVHDVLHPERIVIGVSRRADGSQLRRLYAPFRAPIRTLSPSGAELVKYASNAFLATKVTLANEFARLAERVGVDIDPVLEAVGRDSRIGSKFLRAGPGFGGSCFQKDVQAVAARARSLGLRLATLEAVVRSNDEQANHAFSLVRHWVGGARGRRVALLGLSFKPGTDDVRGSRALPIARTAMSEGASVRVHDPVALTKFKAEWGRQSPPVVPGPRFCRTAEAALRGADVAVIHTPWPEYRSFPAKWTEMMRSPLVVDLRRALDLKVRRRTDLLWIGLGAPPLRRDPQGPRVANGPAALAGGGLL